jgi:hypothetical protein
MKKFFKALALVLALALVIGVVPAQATSAKVKAKKQLYVGGAKGESTDGKKSGIKSKVAIYKLAGYTKETKEGHKFAAELQKDNGVVEVGKRYVTARKLGNAKVDIYVDGEKVGTTIILSKVNATDDTVELLCNGEKMPEEFVVGGKYTFTLPRVGKDSYERRFYINGELVADDEGAPRTYTYSFKKAEIGDVTFKYEAYQSAKLDKAMVSKEYKAKVVPPTPQEAKQTAWNAFDIIFDQDIEAANYYADLKDWESQDGVANDIYYKIKDVKVPFSSVKATSRDKNVLTVTMFGSFVPDETYYVSIAGKTLEFKALGNAAKDVTDIVFTSNEALVATNAKIKFKLLNAAGIDITDTALADVNGSISFTTADTSKATIFDDTIYFYTVGDTANVKGTFTYYDADDGYKAYPTEKSTVIKAVQLTSTLVSTVWSINSVAVDGINWGWKAWNGHTVLPLEDTDAYVDVVATFAYGSDTADIALGGTIPVINKALKVKVADEHYAMVKDPTQAADNGVLATGDLVGVKKGATSFLLYYTDDQLNDVVLASIPFTVGEERKPATLTASAANDNTGMPFLNADKVNGAENTDDTITIGITLKDQYGANFAATHVVTADLTERSGSASDIGGTDAYYGKAIAWNAVQIAGSDFPGASATTEKVVSFDVKAAGLSTVVSFRVKAAGNYVDGTSSVVPFASGTSIDTQLTTTRSTTYCKDQEVHLNYMNGSYFAGRVKFYLTDKDVLTTKDLSDYATAIGGALDNTLWNGATGAAYVAKVLHGSTTLATQTADQGLLIKSTGTVYQNDRLHVVNLRDSITVNAVSRASFELDFDAYNGNNQKLHSGSYTVMFYKITDDGSAANQCVVTPVGSKTITVTDSQTYPSVKQKSQTITANTLAGINAAYEFKWNDAVVNANGFNTKDDSAAGVYVYDAAIPVGCWAGTQNTNYTLVVKIGELLNVGN